MEHAYVFWRAVGSITAFLLTLLMCATSHGAELPNSLVPKAGEICRPAHCFIPKPVVHHRASILCYRFETLVIVLSAPQLVWGIDMPEEPDIELPGDEPQFLLADEPLTPVITANIWIPDGPSFGRVPAKTIAAPEIDPNSASSAVTLLAGMLIVLRSRRK